MLFFSNLRLPHISAAFADAGFRQTFLTAKSVLAPVSGHDFSRADGSLKRDGASAPVLKGHGFTACRNPRQHPESSASRSRHLRAQPRFGLVAPVLAVQPNENRRIRNRFVRLEHQNLKRLPRLADRGNHLVVGLRLNPIRSQQIGDVRPVLPRARRVLVGHKRKLRIHIQVGPHMHGVVDRAQHDFQHINQRSMRLHRFHARRRLQRIRRVDNEDPVAMAEQRHHLRHPGPPCIRRGLGLRVRDRRRANQRESEQIPEHRTSIADLGLSGAKTKRKSR